MSYKYTDMNTSQMSKILGQVLIICLISLQTVLTQKIRYDNYKVYRTTPRSNEELKFLERLSSKPGVSFWDNDRIIVNRSIDLMVSPKHITQFESRASLFKLNAEVIIDNVQRLLDETEPKTINKSTQRSISWDDYYTVDSIYSWLDSLAENYDNVETVIGGRSYEGRDIKGVSVFYGTGKKTVIIEGGIHAREWITEATVTYFLNEILNSTVPLFRDLVESFNWYIFPVINPDGYEYTFTTDRLWRKTRTPYDDDCYGADPNRNWGYHWLNGGSSTDPCSDTYAGPSAFSEVETQSLSEFYTTVSEDLVAYIAFHSPAQSLLISYGDSSDHVENYDELFDIGARAIDALSYRYGTEYRLGNIVDVLYVASGGSMDWIKGTFGTPIVYTYELRSTNDGFILPQDQIIPTALETIDSLSIILEETRIRYT